METCEENEKNCLEKLKNLITEHEAVVLQYIADYHVRKINYNILIEYCTACNTISSSDARNAHGKCRYCKKYWCDQCMRKEEWKNPPLFLFSCLTCDELFCTKCKPNVDGEDEPCCQEVMEQGTNEKSDFLFFEQKK